MAGVRFLVPLHATSRAASLTTNGTESNSSPSVPPVGRNCCAAAFSIAATSCDQFVTVLSRSMLWKRYISTLSAAALGFFPGSSTGASVSNADLPDASSR